MPSCRREQAEAPLQAGTISAAPLTLGSLQGDGAQVAGSWMAFCVVLLHQAGAEDRVSPSPPADSPIY